jgi:membrane-associated phospholipid phosphatase
MGLVLTLLLCVVLFAVPGLSAQRAGVETSGTVLTVLLPATAFATTWASNDEVGRTQFYLSSATNLAATLALKFVVTKDRPDGSSQNSFPSGHTSVAFQSAAFIHLRYGLRYALPAYAGAAFVGYSREDARKHDWVDVLSGAALGTLSSILFTDRLSNLQISTAASGAGYGLQVRLRFRGVLP